MIRLFSYWLVFVSFSFSSALSFASIDYFSTEVPVKSQGREAQADAAKEGLLDVLVRLSGSEQVRENEVVQRSAKRGLSYVTQFEYLDLDDAELLEEGYANVLRLQFSSRLTRQILEKAGLPLWSTSRPKTLLWLVEDHPELGKQMLTVGAESPLLAGVKRAVEYRGLPLAFPLLDFEDQLALGAERLWDLDEEAILEASSRYAANVILVGKFTQSSSGETLSSWQFFHRDRTRVYDLRGEDQVLLGHQAVSPLADFLASLYSFTSLDSEYFSLNVQNVQSYADYRGLMNLLKRMDTVSALKVDRVQGDLLALSVKSDASLEQFKSQLLLGRKLYAIESEANRHLPAWQREKLEENQPLSYRWER